MTTEQSAGIDAAALNFDLLPDSAYVPRRTLAALLGCSEQTIARRIMDGTLPAPVSIVGLQRYNVGDIRAFLRLSVAPAFAFDTPGAGVGQGAFSVEGESNGDE
ncbi:MULTISPECIES: AlpA family transcriptional regulator [unclassified Burkholderia]|uniref:helix-turn-helix transcriptional regulator n=1 Tax=unclassified Burkholderia TaxID=2613784 RepID=UPI0016269203|nr:MULTISPECIES: hypothetical protein [unclassified Burkholderia]